MMTNDLSARSALATAPAHLQEEIGKLPRSLTILLENLIAHGASWAEDFDPFRNWLNGRIGGEVLLRPARILMQDTAGVAALADLAALRDFVRESGGDPSIVDSAVPIDLVIDHSIAVNISARHDAIERNLALEYERNHERYAFFKWAERAFSNLTVIPPGRGICHQINLERLASVIVSRADRPGEVFAETVIGTDSHTTMINALGVLGWGVGGVEAEQVALGEGVAVALPEVINVELSGQRQPGVTATDIALAITSELRKANTVGAFVEFNGPALDQLSLADRAAIANMAPEYGAACGLFPIDDKTLAYLAATGRNKEHLACVKSHAQQTGAWRSDDDAGRRYDRKIEIAMGSLSPVMAGPSQPHDIHLLKDVPASFRDAFLAADHQGEPGAIAIAAITSCTNTANPDLMIAAGLVARKARKLGIAPPAWVKTSLAPGSRRIARLLKESGLQDDLDAIGFHIVGFGCTTCVGNSGDLNAEAQNTGGPLCAVISGNRNFENRIHPGVSAVYLASPPLVVVSALAGDINIDLANAAIAHTPKGDFVCLKDIWPQEDEIAEIYTAHAQAFSEEGDNDDSESRWAALETHNGVCFPWNETSTFIRRPGFFSNAPLKPRSSFSARALLVLGENVTTDHISPVGRIETGSEAGKYLLEHGVPPARWGAYGDRRANHEVMRRGGFSHGKLVNRLASRSGPYTSTPLANDISIFDAARSYDHSGTPLVIIAGKRYGAGSARDWAAKATALYGVRAVLAESFERIHRSNLVSLGVLPVLIASELPFTPDSQTVISLEGFENLSLAALDLHASLSKPGETPFSFNARADLRSAHELSLYQSGGVFARTARRFKNLLARS